MGTMLGAREKCGACATVVVAILAMCTGGCGSGGGAQSASWAYVHEPPEYAVNSATVRRTAVGPDHDRVSVAVWNLGTRADHYDLTATADDGQSLVVSPSALDLPGRAFGTVDVVAVDANGVA